VTEEALLDHGFNRLTFWAACLAAGSALCLHANADPPLFRLDFEHGFVAEASVNASNGERVVRTVAPGISGGVELVDGDAGKAAKLHATSVPGDALYYHVTGLFSPFLGTLDCRVRAGWKPDDGQRHIILDLRNRERTGYVLEKRSDGRLSFSAQQKGRVLTEVTAPAQALGDGRWHAIRAVWHTAGLRLFLDGAELAASPAAVIPSVLGQYLFIGSCYDAVNQFDGLIDDVQLRLTPDPAP
jgi:hypothetical protein